MQKETGVIFSKYAYFETNIDVPSEKFNTRDPDLDLFPQGLDCMSTSSEDSV